MSVTPFQNPDKWHDCQLFQNTSDLKLDGTFICRTYKNEEKVVIKTWIEFYNFLKNNSNQKSNNDIVKCLDSTNNIYIFDTKFLSLSLEDDPQLPLPEFPILSSKTPTIGISLRSENTLIFVDEFFTHLFELCTEVIPYGYISKTHEFNYMIVVIDPNQVIDQKITKKIIKGFAYIRPILRNDLIKKENIKAQPQLILKSYPNQIINLIYVDIICSCKNCGAGSIILDYLERLPTNKYNAIALRGVNSAYSYYIKRGYMRTNDLVYEYPIFRTSRRKYYLEDIGPVYNCLQKIPELLDFVEKFITYFQDDEICNGYLFMKAIIPNQQGGKPKILYKSYYYKIRRNDKNKEYIHTKDGDILLSKIKRKK